MQPICREDSHDTFEVSAGTDEFSDLGDKVFEVIAMPLGVQANTKSIFTSSNRTSSKTRDM